MEIRHAKKEWYIPTGLIKIAVRPEGRAQWVTAVREWQIRSAGLEQVFKESAFGFFSLTIRRYLPGMDDQNI